MSSFRVSANHWALNLNLNPTVQGLGFMVGPNAGLCRHLPCWAPTAQLHPKIQSYREPTPLCPPLALRGRTDPRPTISTLVMLSTPSAGCTCCAHNVHYTTAHVSHTPFSSTAAPAAYHHPLHLPKPSCQPCLPCPCPPTSCCSCYLLPPPATHQPCCKKARKTLAACTTNPDQNQLAPPPLQLQLPHHFHVGALPLLAGADGLAAAAAAAEGLPAAVLVRLAGSLSAAPRCLPLASDCASSSSSLSSGMGCMLGPPAPCMCGSGGSVCVGGGRGRRSRCTKDAG